jgi:hypothetical protein
MVKWKCSKTGHPIIDTIMLGEVASCAAVRKSQFILPGCGDASGTYAANNYRTTNFCANNYYLSSALLPFPSVSGASVDWICRKESSFLIGIFKEDKPSICSAIKK